MKKKAVVTRGGLKTGINYRHPVIGQEAVCPDGLGRVVDFLDSFPKMWIQVDTYYNNRSCKWAHGSVQLVRINFA